MDGPGTYSQPPYAGGSKDESGTAAKDTISIGSGDRVSGADRMGMEVHDFQLKHCVCRSRLYGGRTCGRSGESAKLPWNVCAAESNLAERTFSGKINCE